MLSPEQAKDALKEFEVSDGAKQRLTWSAALGGDLRIAALGLMGYDANARRPVDPAQQGKLCAAATQKLATLETADRLQVFAALFPTLASNVEDAWVMAGDLPYQMFSYVRRAFRAPNQPALTAQVRQRFLHGLLSVTAQYQMDLRWYAQWATYISGGRSDYLGVLLAAAIDKRDRLGEGIFQILCDTVTGVHPIGVFGRHVTRGLMLSSRPEGWDLIEKMLIAAQRQEGLRQVILETIDEAHPTAYRRMLRLILDQDIVRFSSCIRAIDVWFGFQWTAMDARFAAEELALLLQYIEYPSDRDDAIRSAPAAQYYMALHAHALEDAVAASKTAAALSHDPDPARRFASARMLRVVGLRSAELALVPMISDTSVHVALEALNGIPSNPSGKLAESDAFERVERLLPTITQDDLTLEPIVWPWNGITGNRSTIASRLTDLLGNRPATRLLPYLSAMDPFGRIGAVRMLAAAKPLPSVNRDALFALTGDAVTNVREIAFAALADCAITEGEAEQIEGLLTRKATDVRRAALTMLLRQDDALVLATADRLAASAKSEQRLAAVELVAQLRKANRSVPHCRERREAYHSLFKARNDTVATGSLETLLSADEIDDTAPMTLDNALGLLNPEGLSKPTPPQPPKRWLIFHGRKTALESPAAHAIIASLNELLDRHAETTVEYETRWGGRVKELLGNISHGLPRPWVGMPETFDPPAREIWQQWAQSRGPALRDDDGFEMYRASNLRIVKEVGRERKAMISSILAWIKHLERVPGEVEFLIDAFESALAQVPPEDLTKISVPAVNQFIPGKKGWRDGSRISNCLRSANINLTHFGAQWTNQQIRRYWGLLRWYDQPGPPQPRARQDFEILLAAYEAGAATADDVYDHLLGARSADTDHWRPFEVLRRLSGRSLVAENAKHPWLQAYVDRCRERIVDLELRRGDLPGEASRIAQTLAYTGGMQTLVRIAIASAVEGIDRRANSYGLGQGRSEVLSKLLQRTYPGDDESPADFAEAAREARLSEKHLVEIALFAPQWSAHIEEALGWPGCSEAVWWLHAHTKDENWAIDKETRDAWAAKISKRTPLASQDLLDGAVDVEWFQGVQAQLSPDRWAKLEGAAKFASSGLGHKRAQSFAAAMLGKLSVTELTERIVSKRNQDALRCLGLVPFDYGEGAADREEIMRADLLSRYGVIQEFVRGAKQFGAQRQLSEKLAASVAMQNLARTAGYPDPVRLEWAMERAAISDLANGPVEVSQGDTVVRLSIDEWGEANLDAIKGGKALKAIPPAAKKVPEVAALAERKQEISRQRARMRTSLEAAMCRGDIFFGREIHDLMEHPVLRPMIRSLVFVEQESGPDKVPVIGYFVDGGQEIEDCLGNRSALADDCRVRIAHPADLWNTGQWDKWQWECFAHERIQPFKQVFRELYLATAAERENGKMSERYAGHQINQTQARAILGKQGWIGAPNDGMIARTFHTEGVTANVLLDYGYTTPAEVEGLTLGQVFFAQRSSYAPIGFDEVPPRIFSEAMRDLDLVVSVAHQGGVDPEASASTVDMRVALLRDACRLLKIDNVRLLPGHVMIDGKLGKYSVHLGSGIVHRQPGGHVCIVPVHSQHRGRMFLPFADDDPRTAEILSKVVLLSRDSEIKDPIILEQLYDGAR